MNYPAILTKWLLDSTPPSPAKLPRGRQSSKGAAGLLQTPATSPASQRDLWLWGIGAWLAKCCSPRPAATLHTSGKWTMIHAISHFSGLRHRQRKEESLLWWPRTNSFFPGEIQSSSWMNWGKLFRAGGQQRDCRDSRVLKLVLDFHESFKGFHFSTVSVNMQECLGLLIKFSSLSFPGLLQSLPRDITLSLLPGPRINNPP